MASTKPTAGSSPPETWFVSTDDETFELSLDALISGLRTGRVPSSALVWRTGMRSWLALNEVPLLQMLIDRLDSARSPVAKSASRAIGQFDDESEATAVQFAPPATPSQSDDDELTVVAQSPPGLLDPSDDELTVITNTPSDSFLDDDDRTSNIPPLSPASSAPTQATPILAKPIIVVEPSARPPSVEPASSVNPTPGTEKPSADALTSNPQSPKLSLSDRAPPKPHSVPRILAAAAVSDARPLSTAPQGKPTRPPAPPSPSLAALVANKENRASTRGSIPSLPRQVAPPLRARHLESPLPSLGNARPQLPARTTPIFVGSSHPHPAIPAASPPLSSASPKGIPGSHAEVSPQLPNQQLGQGDEPKERVPFVALVSTRATTEVHQPAPHVVLSTPLAGFPGKSTIPETFSDAEETGFPQSLAPSTSSITSALRSPRRHLYLGGAALVAIAATLVLLFGSGPTRKSSSASALRKSAAASELSASPSISRPPETAPPTLAAASDTPIADARSASIAETKTDAPATTVSKPSSAARTGSADQAAASKRSRLEPKPTISDARVVKRARPEAKSTTPESTGPAKDVKKSDPTSSVASWDQGTAEQRPWMSPGF